MSIGQESEYPSTSRRRGLRYLFTAKHHGGGTSHDATWHPSLSKADEFGIFDSADWHEIVDDSGNMYGILRDQALGGLRMLGTWCQQVAKFPIAAAGQSWHGYPLLPISTDESQREIRPLRRSVPREVWKRLLGENLTQAALLTKEEARNLKKGKLA
jgi:hypothetical protein